MFQVKQDNLGQLDKRKSRLIAQGYSQMPGINFNETYSPTIRFTSIQFILALAAHHNLELRQINVKGAYLNGTLEETIYLRQPEGFIEKGKENFICKLNKGLYGLKQSGRVWNQTLRDELLKIGFRPGHADQTVYFHLNANGGLEIVGWYVDDGLLAADLKESMQRMVKDIGKWFKIQDMGEPTCLLGIKIDRNRTNGTIHISQPAFIDTIPKQFDLQAGRCINNPMDPTLDLRKSIDSDAIISIPYASLVGCINYCAMATQPNIAYAVNKCAQFTSHPSLDH
jgi:Reverse transcriptase (RNA-dependent DNA polymerase)